MQTCRGARIEEVYKSGKECGRWMLEAGTDGGVPGVVATRKDVGGHTPQDDSLGL